MRTRAISLVSCLVVGVGVSASAFAADLPVVRKAPPAAAPMIDRFAGPYVGGGVGARQTVCDDWRTTALLSDGIAAPDPILGTPTACLSSEFRGALFADYNWRVAPSWIVGIEGDVGFADDEGTQRGIPGTGFLLGLGGGAAANDSLTIKKSWDGSIRGRLGYNVTPQLLAYGMGGFAAQRVQATLICAATGACAAVTGPATTTASASDTMTGWTAGGGLEYAVASNWLVRGEYRYSDYGTFTNTYGTNVVGSIALTSDITMRTHTWMFGAA